MAKTSQPRVVVLALPNPLLSSLAAPLDVFGGLGTVTSRCTGEPEAPAFDLAVATLDGGPLRMNGGLQLTPPLRMADAGQPDLVIISGVLSFPGMEEALPPAIEWLAERHARGAWLASICTGAFPLARTGLLDDRTATTHWAVVQRFREQHPAVQLQPWRMFTDEQTLFCSAGSTAGYDLCLHVVGRLMGREAALDCARALLVEPQRDSQRPFAVPDLPRGHHDAEIRAAQRRIDADFGERLTIADLAREAGLSPRTFERRFKAATGETPVRYLQRVRVEAAKRMLEVDTEPFDQITYRVGYEDPSTFRALFRRLAGLSPGAYRRRFGAHPGLTVSPRA